MNYGLQSPPLRRSADGAGRIADVMGGALSRGLRTGVLRYPKKSRPCTKAGYLTIAQRAEKLNVTYTKIYWHILDGRINVKKDETTRCFLFPDKPFTVEQFRLLFAGKITQLDI